VKLLSKLLFEEEFIFYTDQSVEALKSDVQSFLSKTTSGNLKGDYFPDSKFAIKPRWQWAVINSFERADAVLKGQIFNDGFNQALVKFTVRPNSIFPILFFGFLSLGIFYLGSDILNYSSIDKLEFLRVISILTASLLILVYSRFVKKNLRDRFSGTFNLKPVR
jgi:hypothetical protein